MASNQMIFSLDIGSSKIVALVGSFDEQLHVHALSTYHFVNTQKAGFLSPINGGIICDLDFVSKIVNQTLNEAKIDADCSFGSVIVNISGNRIINLYANSNVNLETQVVGDQHIQALIHECLQKKLPENCEILDYEVQEYLVDSEYYVINPLNLTAKSLVLHLNLLLGDSRQITNLKKVIRYSGFNLAKIVPASILSALAVLNIEEKELGCCLIDIGATTTDIVVYENGFIRFVYSIPIGGEHVTRDIANVLRISRNLAEDVKLSYGSCSYIGGLQKVHEGINIIDHRGINVSIAKKLLVDVISERISELFELIKSKLEEQKIYDIINSGVVLTGGTALMPSIDEFAKQKFILPVRVGLPYYTGDFMDMLATPKYSTSLGALYFAKEFLMNEFNKSEVVNYYNFNFKSVFTKIRALFK